MNIFTRQKEKFETATSSYALISVYLFSVIIAANMILPIEDSIWSGIAKSFVWPLYVVTKF